MHVVTRVLGLLAAGAALLAASSVGAETSSPRAAKVTQQRSSSSAEPAPEVLTSPSEERRPFDVDVDLLGGVLGIPVPANKQLFTPDRYVGVRLGGRYRVWKLRLGGEAAARSTMAANIGGPPGPLAPLAAPFSMQSVRQSNQLALGGIAGLELGRMDFFVEPFLMGGLSTSMRTLLYTLPAQLPTLRPHPTVGGYLGAGFSVGLRPIFFRMDVLTDVEVGPPPFTTRVFQAQYNLSLGLRL
ncbi:MAG: hypothetical protein AB2A00_37050 [Myxococcota bacterium]